MARHILRAAAVLTVVAALFVAVNRIDTRAPEGDFDESSLPPSSLADDNGAFWLLFLGEPDAVGLALEAKMAAYREWLGRLPRLERLSWMVRPQTRSLGGGVRQVLEALPFPKTPGGDWGGFVRAEGPTLERLKDRYAILLQRYDMLLGCPGLADFGYRVEWDRPYALSSFVLAVTRFHAALRLLDAERGHPEEAAAGLLAEFRLGERLTAAAQTMFFHNLGRSIIDISLGAMAGLLNVPVCSRETAAALLQGLPGPAKDRFSLRAALIGEFLWVSERIEKGDRWRQSELVLRELFPGRTAEQARMSVDIMIAQRVGPENARRLREGAFLMFLMKNRTRGYFRDTLGWLLRLDALPPHRWGGNAEGPPPFRSRTLWWLWNPSGRLLFDSLDPAWQRRAVERKSATRALCDLVRIAAEMRLVEDVSGTAKPDPARLGSWAARDPFSGRAYGWNPGKAVLYSVGPDGKNGEGDPETDIVLPVKASPAGR